MLLYGVEGDIEGRNILYHIMEVDCVISADFNINGTDALNRYFCVSITKGDVSYHSRIFCHVDEQVFIVTYISIRAAVHNEFV